MSGFYLSVLNMSFSGAFVIIVIWLARFPLKKAPKTISYGLWAVAGLRLILLFSIPGLFSLLPFKPCPLPLDLASQAVPRLNSGIPLIDRVVSSALPAASPAGAAPLEFWLRAGSFIWLAGVLIMLIYSVVSIALLKRRLRSAQSSGDNIYEAANLRTPFVIGLFRPRIYIPAGLSAKERRYIILHEQTHIRRCDPAIKMGAYFILCLHWFNPLAWLAFLLMSADMEMSCDEKVMAELGEQIKNDYSRSLIRVAAGRRILCGSPLAFGEGGMKERIKNVLNFKKPTRFMAIASIILAAALGLGLALSHEGASVNAGETEPPIALSITTPRDFYSPFMSSIFGFELVVQGAPPNTKEFHYLCSEGSFCTYSGAQIKSLGADATTAETVYWTAFSEEERQFITKNGVIASIMVTALEEGKILAAGSAPVECGPNGEWFKFLGGKTGDSYSGETALPAGDSTEAVPLPEAAGPEAPQIPTGEPYSSAANAAREYYRGLGYTEEGGLIMQSVRADYSGESETFRSKLKDETVTLSVSISTDPWRSPPRLIVLTRETGGKWEVVRAEGGF